MTGKRKTPLEMEEITPEMCSADVRLRSLGQVPFFSTLKPTELGEINRLFKEQGFEPDESIYFEGAPAEYLYVVAAGKVKLMRHTRSGKDVLLDLLEPGEYFGGLSPLPDEAYNETAQAHTTVCTLRIGKETFRSILASRPGIALGVLEITAARLQAAHERVRQLSVFSVEHRIAFTLLKLAEKFGERQKGRLLIQTPLSRDDLAEMTGTTTESASRAISQLQKAGLIETGRQWVAITDQAGLEAILGEE
jgi:CRP-like cAMP-binding protein